MLKSHQFDRDANPVVLLWLVVKKCQSVPLFRGTYVLSWQDRVVDRDLIPTFWIAVVPTEWTCDRHE
jgi:hypothetical protein